MFEVEIAEETTELKVENVIKIKNERSFLRKKFKCLFETLIIRSCFLVNNNMLNMVLLFLTFSLSLWTLMYLTINKEALPGGLYFSLFILIISCHVVGYICEWIKMPNLLGNFLVLIWILQNIFHFALNSYARYAISRFILQKCSCFVNRRKKYRQSNIFNIKVIFINLPKDSVYNTGS